MRIHVVVATTHRDIAAEGIAAAVQRRPDMLLLESRVVLVDEVVRVLRQAERDARCAVIVVTKDIGETDVPDAERWLDIRHDAVVLRVAVFGDLVQFRLRNQLRNVRLDALLSTLHELAEPTSETQAPLAKPAAQVEAEIGPIRKREWPARERPLFSAILRWIDAVLLDAIAGRQTTGGDLPGLTLAPETVRQLLEPVALQPGAEKPAATAAEDALVEALEQADAATEPFAAIFRALTLDLLEWKYLLLALAPELDFRYQRCLGFLHDDIGRRIGTPTLLASLLGNATSVRARLASLGRLSRWLLLEQRPGAPLAADDAVHVDRAVASWLLGQWTALEQDTALRRVLRSDPWPGAALLRRPQDVRLGRAIVEHLRPSGFPAWYVPDTDAVAWARALLELGANARKTSLVRVEVARLPAADRVEARETAVRIARLARLTVRPVVLDVTADEAGAPDADAVRLLVHVLSAVAVPAALIAGEADALASVLAQQGALHLVAAPYDAPTRAAMLTAAAHDVGLALEAADALDLASRFPLRADQLHRASAILRMHVRDDAEPGTRRRRLLEALRSVAAEGISQLATRIAPTFSLENDVVLPEDRKKELREIVANVRLAPRVLDEWKFGEKLPYGRGVSALFHGPSGTGKTMAAQAIARELGIELFALDLSRVVSKFIGDTEKNIDVVFEDARRAGAAVLIDEADALLGKRSEVKDAHDRYANIEVAYLLQRMESFDGLAILTTNLRQNLDPAFLRRLRFVVDFPRPDAQAREAIWRLCLPEHRHALTDSDFRQLARRVELTGGHIRQITLRAAFVAASDDCLITLRHVRDAVRAELAKLGMPAVSLESAASDADGQRKAA